jgi:hypothetical protein
VWSPTEPPLIYFDSCVTISGEDFPRVVCVEGFEQNCSPEHQGTVVGQQGPTDDQLVAARQFDGSRCRFQREPEDEVAVGAWSAFAEVPHRTTQGVVPASQQYVAVGAGLVSGLLEREGTTRVFILDDEVIEHDAVDAKLVALARRLQLRLLTNDGPLARNAELQGVPTCNLRKLAQELAPAVVPGDFVRVALTRAGKEEGQGVGHLEDGSMVVVNGGIGLVGGPEMMLQVTSVVPTSAGRLVFAHLDSE